MACETGIPVSVLGEEDAAVLDAMVDHLKARARAMSGDDDEIDWDETYGSD